MVTEPFPSPSRLGDVVACIELIIDALEGAPESTDGYLELYDATHRFERLRNPGRKPRGDPERRGATGTTGWPLAVNRALSQAENAHDRILTALAMEHLCEAKPHRGHFSVEKQRQEIAKAAEHIAELRSASDTLVKYLKAWGAKAPDPDPPHADGPEEPSYFWYGNKRHLLDIEPQQFKLLEFLWGKWAGENTSVKISTVGKAVWDNRGIKYDSIKKAVSAVNLNLAVSGAPFELSKPKGSDSIILSKLTA